MRGTRTGEYAPPNLRLQATKARSTAKRGMRRSGRVAPSRLKRATLERDLIRPGSVLELGGGIPTFRRGAPSNKNGR